MSGKGLYAVAAGLGVTGLVALGLLFVLFQAGAGAVTGSEASEGIAVHGRWTIEVRDPDGGLVERREFDNALTRAGAAALARPSGGLGVPSGWRGRGGRRAVVHARPIAGGAALAKTLGGLRVPAEWRVTLSRLSTGGNSPCGGAPAECIAVTSTMLLTGPNIFETLSVSVPNSGPNADKLVLSGSVTALVDGVIDTVGSNILFCGPVRPPGTACGSGDLLGFSTITQASVSPAVSVVAGQQILVTVVITFS